MDALKPKKDFMEVYSHLNSNVNRLQSHLQNTQKALEKIYLRAQNIQKKSKELEDVQKENLEKLQQQQKIQEETQPHVPPYHVLVEPVNKLETSVQTESFIEPSKEKSESITPDDSSSKILQYQIEKEKLNVENVELRNTIQEYQQILYNVISKSQEYVTQLQQQQKLCISTYQSQMEQSRQENEALYSENDKLRTKLVTMVKVMNEVARLRDSETQEVESYAISLMQENETLRQQIN